MFLVFVEVSRKELRAKGKNMARSEVIRREVSRKELRDLPSNACYPGYESRSIQEGIESYTIASNVCISCREVSRKELRVKLSSPFRSSLL